MSYDVWLVIDAGEVDEDGKPKLSDLGGLDWNYTSNCSQMWCEAGADLQAFDGKLVSECLPLLQQALVVLGREPERFRAMDPPNGWGSYDSLVPKLRVLAEAFARYPKAIVRVSW